VRNIVVEGRSDEELEAEGCRVIRPSGISPVNLLWLLGSTEPPGEWLARDTGPEWASISMQEREFLVRLDKWTKVFPALSSGQARAYARHPTLAVLDHAANCQPGGSPAGD